MQIPPDEDDQGRTIEQESPVNPLYTKPLKSTFPNYGVAVLEREQSCDATVKGETGSSLIVPEENELNLVAQAASGRLRALQIAQQFQQQATSDVARKRKAAFEVQEKRKRVALFKNFEYLEKVESQRLEAKLRGVEELRDSEAQVEQAYQQFLQGKSKSFAASRSQAGLGTAQRDRVDAVQKKQQNLDMSDTVAVYVSNLPTDGSVTRELLTALFGGLGYTIRKVHIYYSKQSGEPKGDALIVYNGPEEGDRHLLIETVCSQMNNAELPCGTAIRVEASDPLYKVRKKSIPGSYYGPASKQNAVTHVQLHRQEETSQSFPGDSAVGMEEPLPSTSPTNEDLDDFFDSL
eukprot:Nitzschia sp. Nitz4//scaffold81_size91200//65458//66647//NITZ4_004995-RA/size91200-snap-gene-0.25-mRNA-1//1//CDS//3329558737//930//frame0